MDLTIVIVNWNTRDMLRDCLSSVYTNLGDLRTEVIVVDNASSDGSQLMVEKEFPAVRLIANDQNLGFAAANNQAFSLATGNYVLLLNSDTIVHGSVLESSFTYLSAFLSIFDQASRISLYCLISFLSFAIFSLVKNNRGCAFNHLSELFDAASAYPTLQSTNVAKTHTSIKKSLNFDDMNMFLPPDFGKKL